MVHHGKKIVEARKKVVGSKQYSLSEASSVIKEVSYTKFDGTIEVALNLGVDPRHADQNVRGAIVLPFGLGKVTRVLVFAKGEKIKEAQDAGADYVGGDDMAQKIQGGWLDFETVIATPDMMGVVGKLGKILGSRGLMPNPKTGTVTMNLKNAIQESKAGRVEFRVNKAGIIQAPAGKVSFNPAHIEANVRALIDAVIRAKPSAAKGTYLKSAYICSTMSPSMRLDVSSFK